MFQYDRKISYAVGNSRKSVSWIPTASTIEEFYTRLSTPIRGTETFADFMRMPKSQQGGLKDIGGFVGGTLKGLRRKAADVQSRDLITLDFDNIPGWKTDEIVNKMNTMGYSYCIYSTRKHCGNAPRLRVIMPTDRTMSPDEYEPCARRVADMIGIAMADPTTFDLERLMYWPSCCADGEYIYKYADAPLISTDGLLQSYTDWRRISEWPQVPGSFSYQKLAVRQGDPEQKQGVVGAFCRAYDIFKAMSDLIPGIYDPVDTDDNRFTYLGGSTVGGAIVYDGGKFLFSHHATDPCSGRLVNSFDLVRLHKFSDMDADADPDTPVTKLKSFKAMTEYAGGLETVKTLIFMEQHKGLMDDFSSVVASQATQAPQTPPDAQTVNPPSVPADAQQTAAPASTMPAWVTQLTTSPQTGAVLPTMENIRVILENDPRVAGKFAYNRFAGCIEIRNGVVLPWTAPGEKEERRLWSDTDVNCLYWWLEKEYKITKRVNIDSARDMVATQQSFDDVQDYLDKVKWDGVLRLDTLFVDYLGAADTPYTRAVTRKMFTAAVARAYKPGTKFDNMLILCGPQGIGKSTILERMSRGWFNDSIRTFEGKEASELLQGVWLVEIAELDAFRRTEVSRVKQFLSLTADRFRAAYGRNVKEMRRRCVFFGTCNQSAFLQDATGNRRFWPVDTRVNVPAKSVFSLTAEQIEQIWAEAKVRWQLGESLYLTGELEEEARTKQEEHMEVDPNEGLIELFLSKKIPSDWRKWSIDKRRIFWGGSVALPADVELVDRTTICAQEIWAELFGKMLPDMRKSDSSNINSILKRLLPEWENYNGNFGSDYGRQRGFMMKP